MTVDVRYGFDDTDRLTVAQMFWEAFEGKLDFALAPSRIAIPFLAEVLNPRCTLVAYGPQRQVLGAVGFKTQSEGMFGGDLSDLARHYGWISGVWRGTVLDLFERPTVEDQLLMDGIFVAAASRGIGVGTALLNAIQAHAKASGASHIRLDVVKGNDAAYRLYQRFGFYEVDTTRYPILGHIMGISEATQMRLDPS